MGAAAEAIDAAGLELLGDFDSETWGIPGAQTTRVDYVAARRPSRATHRKFDGATERVQQALGA